MPAAPAPTSSPATISDPRGNCQSTRQCSIQPSRVILSNAFANAIRSNIAPLASRAGPCQSDGVASSEHAPNTELALFRAYPRLVDRIERYPVLSGPTPVEPLDLEGIPDDQLFVKRDDHCSPLIGGNKPRKLEFVVGSALAHRACRLVTTGGLGTHHGLATTIVGRDAGLATTLILVHQPVTREVQQLLLLDWLYRIDGYLHRRQERRFRSGKSTQADDTLC